MKFELNRIILIGRHHVIGLSLFHKKIKILVVWTRNVFCDDYGNLSDHNFDDDDFNMWQNYTLTLESQMR